MPTDTLRASKSCCVWVGALHYTH